ncbi:MAG: hypothetical protein PHD54_14305 [Desulfuromonadaceae bacterium]|nr:hypothetical protein [Desulfuromonadaceae bacterium]
MRYSIVVTVAALSALALSACDRQPVVAPAPPPVIVTVPGPPGPPGPQGAPAEKGATGATGEQGKEGKPGTETILVVPAPAPQR